MEKGCTELVESYEDWDEVLSDNEASLKDINRIMPKVNSTVITPDGKGVVVYNNCRNCWIFLFL